MIELYQGTPGSGKSATAMNMVANALKDGKKIATNFRLVEGWAERLVETLPYWKRSEEKAIKYWENAFFVGSHETVMQLSEKTSGKEGQGLLVIDEAQLIFNSRAWKDNFGYIEFFTQHRKLGWDVLLVAHSAEMIDKQIRPLIEFESVFRNIKNIKMFGVIPVSIKQRFLQIKKYGGLGGGRGNIFGRYIHTLNIKYASMYDSLQVFAFDRVSDKIGKHGPRPLTKKEKIKPCESYPQYYAQLEPSCFVLDNIVVQKK